MSYCGTPWHLEFQEWKQSGLSPDEFSKNVLLKEKNQELMILDMINDKDFGK